MPAGEPGPFLRRQRAVALDGRSQRMGGRGDRGGRGSVPVPLICGLRVAVVEDECAEDEGRGGPAGQDGEAGPGADRQVAQIGGGLNC